MIKSFLASALVAAGAFHLVDATKFCNAAGCEDCPVSTTDSGTGWPDCTIYNTADVFGGSFELNPDTNSYDVWFDVPKQENSECYWIVKTPASTGMNTCGQTAWFGSGGTCRSISLKETFMLQFCCGVGDCCSAGLPNMPGCNNSKKLKSKRDLMSSPIFTLKSNDGKGHIDARGTGSGSLLLVDRDGNLIKPVEQGTAPEFRRDLFFKAKNETLKPAEPKAAPEVRRDLLFKAKNETLQRRGACSAGSWVDDGAEYITTSPYTSVMSEVVDGGSEGTKLSISKERTASWSTTIEANVGFADIISMGISFSVEESESLSTSKTIEFTVPAGQKGYVAWTAYVYCKKGSGQCNGNTVSGTFCTPYMADGVPAGEPHLVQAG